MGDARPNDHDHPALSHDLTCTICGHAPHSFLPCGSTCGCRGHVGNTDQFPPADPAALWLWGTAQNGRSFFPFADARP